MALGVPLGGQGGPGVRPEEPSEATLGLSCGGICLLEDEGGQ